MRLLSILCGAGFAALLLLYPKAVTLLAVAATALAVTIVWRPLWGLLLFAFVAVLMPYSTVNVGFRITVSEALLVVTWAGVSWQLFVGERHWRIGQVERWLIGLAVFSLLPFVVGQFAIQAEGSGANNWLRWLLNLSPLLLLPVLVTREEEREQLVVALLLGVLAMLLLSLAYFLKDRDANTFIPVLERLRYAHPEAVRDIFSANYRRMASPWVHPNLTGGVLVLFLPLAFFYARLRRGWRRQLGLAVTVLGCAGLLFSISRGAIVSLAMILLWLAWRRVRLAGRILGLGLVFGLALALFYPPLQDRLSTMFSARNESTEIRMEEYRMFPEAVERYPLGIGFKIDPPPPGTQLRGISNLWLNYAYKIGLPGMLIYILAIRAWWREWRPGGRLIHLREREALCLGAGAGVLAALFTGLFDHYYSFTTVLIALFWLMMGLNLQWTRPGDTVRADR